MSLALQQLDCVKHNDALVHCLAEQLSSTADHLTFVSLKVEGILAVNTDQVIFSVFFCVCWQNCKQHLRKKKQFPGFLFCQRVQKH